VPGSPPFVYADAGDWSLQDLQPELTAVEPLLDDLAAAWR
jgi:hypothetical protein